ncbi:MULTISPECIES: ABC transporter permease [unclassified Clostridioides]|uniref:ABC transporter permease n=1 Tax=unclassified Clostridioides TaxID=2635829 RepID=UPI001D0C4150|nr:ABC transporter permease [Clostridioides sp. ES-S-0001-02]MCC0640677.1 ABC transporter permease [Clostridioides sp. ES-S-0049-03]MCC0653218.1 ABC transporter permease [Clostridioides sp. ES-S-0001-03]MCC0656774.1 ABC transporter permease [Clostridioides sp. ES-S-0123-01]MCC0672164.1 ABC transporter permease [Clostridioides sp. ES-S-0145-01]MCC0676153.1 ABC transporter permease [Clostridioides sp. ES-W-0018-02]MCC0681484.1 ABC transporter permease [Clostridioides sp. ES-S-0005-03]MCC069754
MKPQCSDFEIVGENYISVVKDEQIEIKKTLFEKFKQLPYISIIILSIIVIGSVFSSLIMTHEPTYMDLVSSNLAPSKDFFFGTDSMGRDIYSMIWYGGKISLFIGIFSTIISTIIGIVYGSISGSASELVDDAMMRFTEIILSIPSILIIIFVQAILGNSNPISMSIVIGITSWMNISKIVRTEVRQIRNSEYILAAKSMGGGFLYILKQHLLPNFVASIMFMVVTNIGAAIGTESTLSFLGIGLPIEIVSWGSMLSLSEEALLSNRWWIILIPGIFLVTTLVCITNIGNYIRKSNNKKSSNL